MKKYLIAPILILLAACNSASTQQQEAKLDRASIDSVAKPSIAFSKYCNARFGYCIDYPKDILFPQPESENLDGRVFKNKNAEEILTVYGMNNLEEEGIDPLAKAFEEDLHGDSESNGNKGRVITYQKLGKKFYVVSGYKDGRIFYHKTIVKDGALAYARIEYNEAEKDFYNAVSEKVFSSFR